MLFPLFVELLLDAGEFGFEGGDGIPLGSEIAGNENGGRHEVGLEAALALLKVVRFAPDEFAFLVFDLTDFAGLRACFPPCIGDEVAIVLHGLRPVVHEVLIDVVGVEQRGGLESGEQILGDGFDERLGMAVLGEAFEQRRARLLPLGEEPSGGFVERGELGVAEDGELHLDNRESQLAVAGAVELLEQSSSQSRHNFPVIAERIHVALRGSGARQRQLNLTLLFQVLA